MHSAEVEPVGPAGQPLPLEVTDITKVFRTRRRGPLARLRRRKRGKQHKRARPRFGQFQGAGRGNLRHPGSERLGKIDAHPHPVHAAPAGPGTGTGLRSRRRQGARRRAAIAQSRFGRPVFFQAPVGAREPAFLRPRVWPGRRRRSAQEQSHSPASRPGRRTYARAHVAPLERSATKGGCRASLPFGAPAHAAGRTDHWAYPRSSGKYRRLSRKCGENRKRPSC